MGNGPVHHTEQTQGKPARAVAFALVARHQRFDRGLPVPAKGIARALVRHPPTLDLVEVQRWSLGTGGQSERSFDTESVAPFWLKRTENAIRLQSQPAFFMNTVARGRRPSVLWSLEGQGLKRTEGHQRPLNRDPGAPKAGSMPSCTTRLLESAARNPSSTHRMSLGRLRGRDGIAP